MLTKFESKSNRVKGLSFHPSRPWILASLHNGSIQWWDYRMGTLLDRFDEHEGPVRAIAFHPTQPLFTSGGDDYKIRVWNYKQRRCLFTLHGHLDFVRTVQFHHEAPWIVSASDDYTIRIWNWQSRTCLAVLTGHHHYVMSAQFHPKDDLIVSASYDFTIRVWDFSLLRKKHFPGGNNSLPPTGASILPGGVNSGFSSGGGMSMSSSSGSFGSGGFGSSGSLSGPKFGVGSGGRSDGSSVAGDLFGSSDASVKYVLEGHDKCVNWASFHPTLPLIVSGGDDRQIKIWRMSETKAWEVDTFRGHFNNVSNTLFHPRAELILSAAEDKTIRVWDMAKRTVAHTFRREHDRFWVMVAHPSINLFAAGHDSGLIVFKLERERPAMHLHQNTLIYVHDRQLATYDIVTGQESLGPFVKGNTGVHPNPRLVSFNPTERIAAVTIVPTGANDASAPGSIELFKIDGQSEALTKIPGHAAVFVARNRLAVLDKSASNLYLYDTRGTKLKDIRLPNGATEMFFAGIGKILISTGSSIELWDVQQGIQVAEISNVANVKYVAFSSDMTHVALLSKHVITLANAHTLQQVAVVHETIRVKSATFDGTVLIYSTLNHIKYALSNGDNGILCTLDQPLYLVHVANDQLLALSRDHKLVKQHIDGTEYRFKRALIARDYSQVLHIINNSNLLGQSIIAYLQKKGYPEVALHFVQDPATRLDLALECGHLDAALAATETLDSPLAWKRLAKAATTQGNVALAELAMQKVKNLGGLSLLYVLTGQQVKLAKMLEIAQHRADPMAQMHNAILLGSIEDRARVLAESGLISLAWLMCRTHGLSEHADTLAAQAGLTPDALQELEPILNKVVPTQPTLLVPPRPLAPMADNWLLLDNGNGYFASAPTNSADVTQVTEKIANVSVDDGWGTVNGSDVNHTGNVNEETSEADWGFDIELPGNGQAVGASSVSSPTSHSHSPGTNTGDLASVYKTLPMMGLNKKQSWLRSGGGGTNSAKVLDHIVAGSFESAMALLNRTTGISIFTPLRPVFLIAHAAASAHVPIDIGGSHEIAVSRNWQEAGSDPLKARAVIPLSIEGIKTGLMTEASKIMMQASRIPDALNMWREALLSLALVADDPTAQEQVNRVREYVRGLSMEIYRREIESNGDTRRNVELAAYFAQSQLDSTHRRLSIQVAIGQSHKAGYLPIAAHFARQLLDLNPPPPVAQKATQLIALAEAQGSQISKDLPPIDYDPFHVLPICSASMTAIHESKPATCQYCKAVYKPEFVGSVCVVCQIAVVNT